MPRYVALPMDPKLTQAYLKTLFELRKNKAPWVEQVLEHLCEASANIIDLLERVEQSKPSDLSTDFHVWRIAAHAYYKRKTTRAKQPARTQQVQVAARRNGRANRPNNKVG